ncbi:6-carboxytetrahydropterin synthase [Paenisporosarcina cavernae]|uniref:6-carboxy-5,6,7,8-tetrahydropterin synthase n=1 Tax=Paenisporosarcina cavernae TaxID=2320858 RepID=A0A385YPY6_9BACL|nr:6-pyruvoyl tetrahydropterin synthase family protein [Paenisporosarcina cavernae]AYC28511.1 6-carboxytetrahydropterin synthase [Paenisporosarcina cavernae]
MIQQLYPQTNHSFRYELNKDMHLAAAHFIDHQSAGVCQEMHGHTYFINMTIAGNDLDEIGFLVDFKQLKSLIHSRFDHTVMNNHPEFKGVFPTTERIAEKIWGIVQAHLDTLAHSPRCLQVFVRETPTSYVVYRPLAEDFR